MPCMVCAKPDGEESFMLCDGCETGGGHVECLGLEAIPEGDWFCLNCVGSREAGAAEVEVEVDAETEGAATPEAAVRAQKDAPQKALTDQAGWVLRTSTRPTSSRRTESARLCEIQH